jgi:hypothetical protein
MAKKSAYPRTESEAPPLFVWYVYASGLLLVVVGLVMVLTASERLKILQEPDVLFGAQNRIVLALAGLLHVALVGCLLATRSLLTRAALLLWLGINHVVYRLGLIWMHVAAPAPLLRAMGLKLEAQATALNTCWTWLIGYLVAGSVLVALSEWRRLRRLEADEFMTEWRRTRQKLNPGAGGPTNMGTDASVSR